MIGVPRRGEVYRVAFDPVPGSEQAGERPALVVQNDVGNRFAPTTIVVPLTRRQPSRPYPFLVGVTGVPGASVSWIHCGQVRAVDKTRLVGAPIAVLDVQDMRRVDDALRASLGMY